MAADNTTIARPYAGAIFDLADEKGAFDQWSEMLELLSAVVVDPAMAEIISNPNLGQENTEQLITDVVGDKLSNEGQNLVKLLIENKRLQVLPEITLLFNQLKSEKEGTLEIEIVSAFDIDEAQQQKLADALKSKLGKEVKLETEKDPTLMGGVKIRAGDLVIDGSVKHKIARLATELGI